MDFPVYWIWNIYILGSYTCCRYLSVLGIWSVFLGENSSNFIYYPHIFLLNLLYLGVTT